MHPAAPTIYSWVRENQIPCYKKGKGLFFKKSEIDKWMAALLRRIDHDLGIVRGWMYFQQVPNYKVGQRVYFSKKAINKWIRLHVAKGDVECFKGLTEEDLKAYPVEPEEER